MITPIAIKASETLESALDLVVRMDVDYIRSDAGARVKEQLAYTYSRYGYSCGGVYVMLAS